jgi:hypothetical protein
MLGGKRRFRIKKKEKFDARYGGRSTDIEKNNAKLADKGLLLI